MKELPPATPTARKLLAKLTALAERGINGEREAAKHKLARLKKRYDFTAQGEDVTDFLSFPVTRAPYSSDICSITEPDIANAVKWAFEHKFTISCRFAGDRLLAEVIPATAKNLESAAGTIATAFRTLWSTFHRAGAEPADRRLFMAGLYDGMMADERKQGEPLPTRVVQAVPRARAKRRAMALAREKLDGKFVPLVVTFPAEVNSTWRQFVRFLFSQTGGTATLEQLYDLAVGHPKVEQKKHWQDKIRQEVQNVARRIGPGTWQQTVLC